MNWLRYGCAIAAVAAELESESARTQALRRHDSELRQMCPQRVHQHRALTHQLLAATMQQLGRLLLRRLHRHKSHRRAPNRLANRFGISGIVLIALDVRLISPPVSANSRAG